MNLRTRLTTYSTIVFGIVFFIASLIIFLAYFSKTQESVFNNLKNTTLLSAIYYLEQDELSHTEHSVVKEEFRATIQSKNVAVYNFSNQLSYGALVNDPVLTNAILSKTRTDKSHRFKANDFFYYGIYYPDNQGDFVVYTRESTADFMNQMRSLILILCIVLVGGLLAIYFLSKYISNIAYKPLKNIVQQVNEVNYSNLENGIEVPKTNDELEELISTYNNLLIRLSETFLIQKNFINYVSHEFKTPLTAISGNLEVFAQKERSPEEYNQVVKEALKNVYKIENILSNLLLLSGLKNTDKDASLFRIDEIIWNIYEALQDKLTELQTTLEININVDDFTKLEYKGNETLIHLALYNIIENAVKYSNSKPVSVELSLYNNRLQLKVKDHGKGISEEELTFIKQTFYRGKNVGDIKGSGIGLSLATIIFEQHRIQFDITSQLEQGTIITLTF
ncbi:HAMP domain-containing sensor histidine kinase [Myroides odoratimimus]|uniref:HAMP domain-containing sensor histidine kinase n=1 Tax=Myroides odoratimimus TaxID=76832 RepID=UPI002574C36E|nr:HAMP domain-containing sensor histidine kinase [Myroides odoratimimus]MDM1498066.1 HAMP domain-containing histidine kinase [Myroides odoratimimus]